VEEDLIIYRLPGDKLGLGLRFEGGAKASEVVQRLFVQSCAPNSPSAKTKCTWGYLSEGDEVISISGKIVRRMTRVDCVKALKGKDK
jgi:C-terminal processing protease CtpA/Prc